MVYERLHSQQCSQRCALDIDHEVMYKKVLCVNVGLAFICLPHTKQERSTTNQRGTCWRNLGTQMDLVKAIELAN